MDQPKPQELIETLTKNYRVLPLYEQQTFQHRIKNHVSLQKNSYLACKWAECKDNLGKKKRQPFQFPQVSDFHFYNYHNCYKPSESTKNRKDYRYSLTSGPGVDEYGEIPIPNEMIGIKSDGTKSKRNSTKLTKTRKRNIFKRRL
ncbi:unnamed protein product [Danaus chrysippus]|uniref:(African queen) hypothetical protein n=1 Tax=Danaus chrysippus TaxID=151541 RepID=A0A8J2W8V6_9NEOP|nr:unnamed protein product [Danaus chrysippus]